MLNRGGHPYLLEESSKRLTAPKDIQQIAAMFAEINAKLDTLKILDERLTKVESTRDQTPSRNNRRHNIDNPTNPDAQYLKSIKIGVLNFEGYHDPQSFIDWTL